MQREFYSYNRFLEDIDKFKNILKDEQIDCIVAVARGGLTLGHFISSSLNIRSVYAINSIHYDNNKRLKFIKISNIPHLKLCKKVLIVDDIIDSGDTISAILKILKRKYSNVEFKTLSIYQKATAKIKADFSIRTTDKWVEFFWEI